MSGFVSLVGAGPGNPELLTLLAKRRLVEADVILYDRLVNPALLMETNAEKIDVGKLPHHHKYSQYKINDLLVTLANEGKRVVRLKAGDPYLFGRGGEESQYLKRHHVDYEVVPGITSAIAGLGAVGIPITHRDFASAFHVITGHRKKTGEELDWQNIAHQEGTLVFLMGMEQLAKITSQLIENGKDPKTPVAVIQWATHWNQRSVLSDLANIVQVVAENQIGSPALIVVGQVAQLMQALQPHPALFGQHILVPYKKQSKLFGLLQDAGASVGFFQRGETQPVDFALPKLSVPATLFVNDIIAYRYFQDKLMAAGADLRKLADWQFIAKNHVVARHLKSSGIVVDRVADLASTSGQPTYVIGEQRELADMNPQAAVHLLATYRRLPAEQDLDFADYQTIVFPSSASVAELVSSLSQDQLEALRVLKCIAMGPKVAEKCHQVGLNNVVTVEPSYQAVLTVLKEAKNVDKVSNSHR